MVAFSANSYRLFGLQFYAWMLAGVIIYLLEIFDDIFLVRNQYDWSRDIFR